MKAELVLDAAALLGEGPSWDSAGGALYWVDIENGRVHRYEPATGKSAVWELGRRVGAVVPRAKGGCAVAAQGGFFLFDTETGALTPVANPEADLPDNRFNDGKCDAAGRFLAGTMSMKGERGRGALYALEPDGRVRRLLDGVTVSNGIAWSPDRRTMYYIDSPTRRVVAYDYDLETGELANPREAVSFEGEAGDPDGMTSDEEGTLWIAHWGGRQVSRWDPATGRKIARIDVPVDRVTSCVFGGERLDVLYVTTARVGCGERELASQPHAGGLFAVRPGVRGSATYAYRG